MSTALEELIRKNQNLKGLTTKPDGSTQMQFYDNVQTPVDPGPTPVLGQVIAGNPGQALGELGSQLAKPETLNMLATIAQAINPAGSWAERAGGAVKQRSTNQLYNQLLQSVLQNQGGASPFQQAPQR